MNGVAESIARLLPKSEPVLVGVSGGVDSMVLLHLLAAERDVHVAHLNHQLRGTSSDADERLVKRAARELRVDCHVESADVKGAAREGKVSTEMAARELRHEFYARLGRKLGIRRLALAHHADDQVELFFLRLFRGAGPEGLAGMAEISPSPVEPSLTIVRPLLGVTKAQLRAYAMGHSIAFREDATNASSSILRNRIRHKLIPLLTREYQPGLAQTIGRVMQLLKAESEFIAQEVERWSEPFDELPVALQRRRIQQQLHEIRIESSFDLVEHLRLRPNSGIMVGPEQIVAREPSGGLRISEPAQWRGDSLRLRIAAPGSINFSGVRIDWSYSTKSTRRKSLEVFDADKIGDVIVLRHWQPGDRFQPIGMGTTVKLQDLFTNQKIPRARRHRLAVAATERGDIFWVEGLRIGERFKIQTSTTRRLHWCWERERD